ncbi:MAG: hypothetical protein ACM3X4_01210 [Ignavibacteriales bacterium]
MKPSEVNDRVGLALPPGSRSCYCSAMSRDTDLGYEDKWKNDGFFRYVGEGQRGDMRLTKGNKAIAEHGVTGKRLMLFLGESRTQHRFLGYMDCVDHYWTHIPDVDGAPRNGIVFRLAPARLSLN